MWSAPSQTDSVLLPILEWGLEGGEAIFSSAVGQREHKSQQQQLKTCHQFPSHVCFKPTKIKKYTLKKTQLIWTNVYSGAKQQASIEHVDSQGLESHFSI